MLSEKDLPRNRPPCDQSMEPGTSPGSSRRRFLGQLVAISAGLKIGSPLTRGLASSPEEQAKTPAEKPLSSLTDVTLKVNGRTHQLRLDPRVTLLDVLRERLHLTGSKKGCDQGACGACTVHVGGRRVLSCLTLAVMAQGKEITTIEGLADGSKLHPFKTRLLRATVFNAAFVLLAR